MKVKEKRVVKGYKVTPTDYKRAKKRADKIDFPLASLIEEWVIDFGKYGTILKELQNKKITFNHTPLRKEDVIAPKQKVIIKRII